MVDADRVLRLLNGIHADVAFLARFADRDVGSVVADEVALSGIKYRFVTAIEGCAKVAHHLAAAERWPVAESNGQAVRQLAEHGVIHRDLARSIADAVGFRNLLVHQYGDVDDHETAGHLAHLDDLRSFTQQVARWLATSPPSDTATRPPAG